MGILDIFCLFFCLGVVCVILKFSRFQPRGGGQEAAHHGYGHTAGTVHTIMDATSCSLSFYWLLGIYILSLFLSLFREISRFGFIRRNKHCVFLLAVTPLQYIPVIFIQCPSCILMDLPIHSQFLLAVGSQRIFNRQTRAGLSPLFLLAD